MKLPDTSTITGSIMAQIVIATIRGILNRSLKETTPKMLVDAINNNTSLWGEVNGDIMSYVQELPPFVATGIKEARVIIDTQYGGLKKIVLTWLDEDHPIYANIIRNSPGGEEWIERQINEILDGVQDSVKKEDVKPYV
jgi:hypothetical protein